MYFVIFVDNVFYLKYSVFILKKKGVFMMNKLATRNSNKNNLIIINNLCAVF